ncbi:MAG: SRPBCC family protein [Candidatus Rokuibacteriota bacterium]
MTRRRSRFRPDGAGILGVGAVLALAGAGVGAWALAKARRARRISKRRPDMPALAGGQGSHVERTVTILRSPAELYAEWRDLERLPELMPHLASVTLLGGTRSRWVVRGPGGTRPAWEAEIVGDEPGRLIAWRSVGEGDVENAGSVRFTPAPGDRGTEVKVILTYAPPAGRLGVGWATLFGRSADQEVREDLRRFKQRMEAHEVATSASARRTAGARDLVRSA